MEAGKGANTEGGKEMSTCDLVRAPQQTVSEADLSLDFVLLEPIIHFSGQESLGQEFYHLLQKSKIVRFSYQVFKIVHHFVICRF